MADELIPVGYAANKQRMKDLGDGSVAAVGVNVSAAATGGGVSVFSAQGLYTGGAGNAFISNTARQVKTGAGSLYALQTNKNTNVSDCFILFYDSSTTPTVGTTQPVTTFTVPSNGYEDEEFAGEDKVAFVNGIWVACVMTASNGNLAPATPFGIDVLYK